MCVNKALSYIRMEGHTEFTQEWLLQGRVTWLIVDFSHGKYEARIKRELEENKKKLEIVENIAHSQWSEKHRAWQQKSCTLFSVTILSVCILWTVPSGCFLSEKLSVSPGLWMRPISMITFT